MVAEPGVIAKSNIILDVKPWDDETDMSKLEECVRSIEMDGLLWGACKLQQTAQLVIYFCLLVSLKSLNFAVLRFSIFYRKIIFCAFLVILNLTVSNNCSTSKVVVHCVSKKFPPLTL